mmetsp:Transcript_36694/g.85715  ORF Transcript_36694/g.85715 Transcript_36694/m.85715 type:complete len:200 (+) Transcript_36694:396-995(+)
MNRKNQPRQRTNTASCPCSQTQIHTGGHPTNTSRKAAGVYPKPCTCLRALGVRSSTCCPAASHFTMGRADLRRRASAAETWVPSNSPVGTAVAVSTTKLKSSNIVIPSLACCARIAYARLALGFSVSFTCGKRGLRLAMASIDAHFALFVLASSCIASCFAWFTAEHSSNSFGSISMKSFTTLHVNPCTVEFQCERELV